MHAGIRCVPTSPLVLAPQTKNVPARIQNTRERLAIANAESAATKGFSAGAVETAEVALAPSRPTGPTDASAPAATPAAPAAAPAPIGRNPLSSGRSRIQMNTIGVRHTAAAAIVITAALHPDASTILASSGRNTSCPVAALAVSIPNASP